MRRIFPIDETAGQIDPRTSRPRRAIFLAVALLLLFAAPASLALRGHAAKSKSTKRAATPGLRAPSLQSPRNGASAESLPTFTWGAVPKANGYQFQLSANLKFSAIVSSQFGKGSIETTNIAATVDKAVPDGTYYWRVRALAGKSTSGRWSAPRRLVKAWRATPQLLGPNATTVNWPSQPLVFGWTPVPYAVKYQITVASDPNLANQVLGTRLTPIITQGTVYTPGVPLDSGTYFWTVTPIDAEGHKGAASAMASFSYTWLTGTSTEVTDLNPDPRVFEPLFSWAPIPGAVRYEVEVNSSEGFPPGSKWCCTGTTVGTSMAPTRNLANNRYYWRVRGLDAKGNPGAWNNGPPFKKAFDSVEPSISNLTVRDATGNAQGGVVNTDTPIVTWDPVPGASRYEVQTVPYGQFGCEWSLVSKFPNVFQAETTTTAWTPLGDALFGSADHIGPSAWPRAQETLPFGLPSGEPFQATTVAGSNELTEVTAKLAKGDEVVGPGIPEGTTVSEVLTGKKVLLSAAATESRVIGTLTLNPPRYCVRVLARSDDDAQTDQVVSNWTQINGANHPAFTYLAPQPATESSEREYISPIHGTSNSRTPLFTWKRIPGAAGYYVVIAYDEGFTEVADVGFTNVPAYAPRLANELPLADETTSYYWAVIPSALPDGYGVSDDVPQDNSPQFFNKLSVPPSLSQPADGAVVGEQPNFRWGPVENARNYRIQVSQDSSFGHPLEDVTTDATAYTPSTTYPANTRLYWRVRGNDWTEKGLQWSQTRTFVRTLPSPVPSGSPSGGEAIPALGWSIVQGATGYEVHVDKVNGFSLTASFPAAAATPLEWYGVGVWRWQVRADFPSNIVSQPVTSAYSAPQPFVRTLNAPSGARGVRAGGRVVVSWSPHSAAKQYEVDISTTDGFAKALESHRTDETSWAPVIKFTRAQSRSPLFWRVAAVDAMGNIGSFASGTFGGPHPAKKAKKKNKKKRHH